MLVFLFSGIDYVTAARLADRIIAGSHTDEGYVALGSDAPIEIDCFDTESGKRYQGAQALAMFIDARKKEAEEQAA